MGYKSRSEVDKPPCTTRISRKPLQLCGYHKLMIIRTESAREALKTFFCDLCQKGYSRVNEFEAHEGSYDHQHKKRLKEMRALSRDPTAASRAREREEKDSGVFASNKNIALSTTTSSPSANGGNGFKKGGFKKATGFTKISGPDPTASESTPITKDTSDQMDIDSGNRADEDMEVVMERNDEEDENDDWDRWGTYDPFHPTGCAEAGCSWNGMG